MSRRGCRSPGANNQCYGDHLNVMEQAKAAATARGFAVGSYDNFVVYFPYAGGLPGNDCAGYAGGAYVGAQGTWLNGFMDRRVTMHEQGHNHGLWHGHSNLCANVLDAPCTFSEYGDDFDAMGSSNYVGHFSGSQKSLLGWMGGRTVDLTTGGAAALVAMADDSTAPHAVVVNASSTRQHWLEFRQPIDSDRSLPPAAPSGSAPPSRTRARRRRHRWSSMVCRSGWTGWR